MRQPRSDGSYSLSTHETAAGSQSFTQIEGSTAATNTCANKKFHSRLISEENGKLKLISLYENY